jgi:Ca2+-binding EF-hand superfamily protein
MKRLSLTLLLAIGLAALASAFFLFSVTTLASAQNVDVSRIVERMRAADSDKDGAVTRQEFLSHRSAQFARFDRNDDGYLSSNDVPRFARRRANGKGQTLAAEFDSNGDGRVTRAEFVDGPTLGFDRMDANGDDVVARAEFEAALAAAR